MNRPFSHRAPRWGFSPVVAGLLLLLILTACNAQATPPGQPWRTDWPKALAEAKREGRPVVAMFSASWCPPCKRMKKQVLPRKDVKKALERWIPIFVDVDKHPNISREHKPGRSIPTFVFLAPNGRRIGHVAGSRSPDDFIKTLNQHWLKFERMRPKPPVAPPVSNEPPTTTTLPTNDATTATQRQDQFGG